MRHPLSLTLRLSLLFSATAVVVFLAFGWIIGSSIEEHFVSGDSKELRIIAQAVEQSLTTLQSNEDLTRIEQRFDDLLVGHHTALLHILDANGNQVYASPGPDFSSINIINVNHITDGVVQTWSDSNNNFRVLVHRMAKSSLSGRGPYTVFIAVSIDYHLKFLSNFRRTLWLMVICGIAVMGLMGWLAVRHGHKPLHHMVNQIRQIRTSQLDARLDPDSVPVELADVASSFNELLQRIEEAFIRLSNFSEDIAHELRTPITNLMTQTQVTLSKSRTTEDYQEILFSSMEEYERMSQIIGDMLFLAKADNGLCPPNTTEINIECEIRSLFEFYEAWAESNNVNLALEGTVSIPGDKLMLRRALSNILSNAIRHTPSGKTVCVNLSSNDDCVYIDVKNPGKPIPADKLSKVFDRFYRVDPSRQRSSEGAGLGLAIVKSIILVHHGNISVTSDSSATQFRITLPKSF